MCCLYRELKGNILLDKGYCNKNLKSEIVLVSITKLYTTACIMALHKVSKLSLDDKISQYLTDYILKACTYI